MLTAASAFALFLMLAIASLVYFIAIRFRLPYTVLLAFVGVLLVPVSSIEILGFLREFQLTPELLFFIFLPTLLFESAYNINVRRVVDEIVPIMLLAVFGYLLSAVLIGGVLWFTFNAFGFGVPFLVTFLFGALISATDPVAVLALFKEYGTPERLSLIFEGESLMNDATALALFVVVLSLIESGVTGGTVLLGGITFATMLVGGIILGLFIGALFVLLIGLFRKHEIVAITLMIVLAHSTFLIAELSNIGLEGTAFSFIQFSPIIATTVASLMMGNYGRFKITPKAEEFIQKFWSQFAFMANSIVFILVGFLFASIPSGSESLIVAVLVTVFVVAASRAISIYSLIIPYNVIAKKMHRITLAWQHLLAWGSLRGALAVMLVLLIPKDLAVSGWDHTLSIQDFLLVLTVGCIFTTLFIKAPAVGPLMRKLGVSELNEIETASSNEAQAFIQGTLILKLKAFAEKKYIPKDIAEKLITEHQERFLESCKQCHDSANSKENEIAERVLRIYLIGLEREVLKELLAFNEVNERVFRRIRGKLSIQSEAIEHGDLNPDVTQIRDKRDVFENMAEGLRKVFVKDTEESTIQEKYLYYRAYKILSRKAIKELHRLEGEFSTPIFTKESIASLIEMYTVFGEDAEHKAQGLRESHPKLIKKLDETLAYRSVYRVEERTLEKLYGRDMLSQKLFINLKNEYEEELDSAKRS